MPCILSAPACAWFGGLPAVILVAATAAPGPVSEGSRAGEVLNRFSALALYTMVTIVVSGLVVANLMIDTNFAGLVATAYGWLLITKLTLLAIILSIASRARSVWVPALNQSPDIAAAGGQNPDVGENRVQSGYLAGHRRNGAGQCRAGQARCHR